MVTVLLAIVALIGTNYSGQSTCLGQRTTLEDAGNLIGINIPAPSYLPDDYEIQEVYIEERNHNHNMTDIVVLLISGEEIEWQGDEYQYKIEMTVFYGAVVGLKMPWARRVKVGEVRGSEVRGYLVNVEGDYYELCYEWPPNPNEAQEWFQIWISASEDIPETELLNVAASTLY